MVLLSVNTGITRANQGRGQPRRALHESKPLLNTQQKIKFLDESPEREDLNLKPGLIVRYNRKNEERHGSLILASTLEGMVNLEKMQVDEGESIQAAIERIQANNGRF